MVKIYNIHSATMSDAEFEKTVKDIGNGKDIFMLNSDLRYEVIDLDKMVVMKSKLTIKGIYAMYAIVMTILSSPKRLFNKLRKKNK